MGYIQYIYNYIYTVYTELQGKMITHWIFLIHVFFPSIFGGFPSLAPQVYHPVVHPGGQQRHRHQLPNPCKNRRDGMGKQWKTQLGGKTRVSLGNIQLKERFGWLYMISYSIPQLFRFHVTAIFCSNLQTLLFFEEIHSWSRSNRLPLALYHQEDDLDNHAPGRMTAFGVKTPGSKMFIPRKSEPCSQFLEWEQYIKVYESIHII